MPEFDMGWGIIQTADLLARIASRPRSTLWFYQDNVPANQAAVALTCLGDAVRTSYGAPAAGTIVGIVVISNAACTGDSCTVDATIAGAVTGIQAQLNLTDTQVDSGSGSSAFTAGQLIGVKVTTTAGWLPVTADIQVGVTVQY